MKICPRCGTPQKDENTVCVECGTVLGDALSEEEGQAALARLKASMKKRPVYRGYFEYDPYDPFSLGWKQYTVAILNCAAVITALVLIFLADTLPVPHADVLICVILFCGIAAIDMFFPQINWGMTKLGAELRGVQVYDGPNGLYMFLHRMLPILAFIIGVLLILISLQR